MIMIPLRNTVFFSTFPHTRHRDIFRPAVFIYNEDSLGWQLCTSFHYVSKELKMVVLLKFVMFSTFLSRRLGEILNSFFLLTLMLLHYVLIMFIIKKRCLRNNLFHSKYCCCIFCRHLCTEMEEVVELTIANIHSAGFAE